MPKIISERCELVKLCHVTLIVAVRFILRHTDKKEPLFSYGSRCYRLISCSIKRAIVAMDPFPVTFSDP